MWKLLTASVKTLMFSVFDHPLLGNGFRPFFLLGALYGVMSTLLWGFFYAGYIAVPSVLANPVLWHAHEMIYGFTLAIVAGFLLTAVPNWTGGTPVRGFHLFGLCSLWLAGRVVMSVELGLPEIVIWIIEAAFVPALAISISISLLKSWNKQNFVFLALLGALFFCNLAVLITQKYLPLYIAVMIVVTMISLIGGRIIPAFTVAALQRRGEQAHQVPQRYLDMLALASLVLIILVLIFMEAQSLLFTGLAFASATVHALRLRRYHTRRILNDPMVWVLHLGYGWVVVGLFLMGLAGIEVVAFSISLHALTVGAIGTMTLGMMSRVSLGHTGRDLIVGKVTTISFALMQLAVLLRVLGPVLAPNQVNLWIIMSAFLWSACFALYVLVYAPILWKKRPDGRPA